MSGRLLRATTVLLAVAACRRSESPRPALPWHDEAGYPSTARGPEAELARRILINVRASASFWRVDTGRRGDCPTVDDLRATPSAAFDPVTMGHDPWGTPPEIECDGPRVRARSWGPDRTRGTDDDLVER